MDPVTALELALDETLLVDRHRLRRKLREVREAQRARKPFDQNLSRLQAEVARAQREFQQREAARPPLEYDGTLPIHERRGEILAAIQQHQVLVLCGETGSGKSTQLPKLCLECGRGRWGMIGHTQPRRIAARTIAQRVAEELRVPLGREVGYQVRFTDATSPTTLVKLMTDGLLLAESQTDRWLNRYDTLIVDEAHERSLNIDFLLGYLHRLLPRRKDLKLIITSATIDAPRFAEHFRDVAGDVPILTVSGRTYPVEIVYWPDRPGVEADADRDPWEDLLAALEEVCRRGPGDVLVFFPTERDIHEAMKVLKGRSLAGGRPELLPLYARLSVQEQQRVFQPSASGRRLVLATNVAESSLTVPGIRSVVDTGTARISRYSPRSKLQRLPVEAVSQASADQRAGRCGRVGPGVCIRLFSRDDYAQRERYTPPEILRSNLAAVMLQLEALGLGPVEQFPFLDPPKPEAVRDAYKTLFELGAVAAGSDAVTGEAATIEAATSEAAERGSRSGRYQLTPLGRRLHRLPVDPRIARMILAAENDPWLDDVLIIAAALEVQDPRERPLEKQDRADEAHSRFSDPDSDFLSYLRLWDFYHGLKENLTRSQLRKACQQNFLSAIRLKEWFDVHRELAELVWQLRAGDRARDARRDPAKPAVREPSRESRREPTSERVATAWKRHLPLPDGPCEPQRYAAIHRALLTGLLSNVAYRTEAGEYLSAGGFKANLWPGSGLLGKSCKWIITAELVETTRRYLRTNARIDPAWIEPAAGHLIQRTYSDPYWDADAATTLAFEKVSLFGLPVVPRQRVRYSRIDPVTARAFLLREGLVLGLWTDPPEVLAHNLELIQKLTDLQARARRPALLRDEEALIAFYKERIPPEICDGQQLKQWLRSGRMPRGPAGSASRQEPAAAITPRKTSPPALFVATANVAAPSVAGPEPTAATTLTTAVTTAAANAGTALRGPTDEVTVRRSDSAESADCWSPAALRMTEADVLEADAEVSSVEAFPEAMRVGQFELPLEYKHEPGELHDGVTVRVPPEGLNQLDAERLGWLVPGLLEEKVTALLRSLPKDLRRDLVPLPEIARQVATDLNFGQGDLRTAIAASVERLTGVSLPVTAFQEDKLPEFLRLRVEVVDHEGQQLGVGRDLQVLREKLGAAATARFSAAPDPRWTRDGLTGWSFGDVPEAVPIERGGVALTGYPTLLDQGSSVALRLLDSPVQAGYEFRFGLIRLFCLTVGRELKQQVDHLPAVNAWTLLGQTLPQPLPLRAHLMERIAERAFLAEAPWPRTQADFGVRVAGGRRAVPQAAVEVARQVQPLFEAYGQVRRLWERTSSPQFQSTRQDILDHLAHLLAPGFLIRTPWMWFVHFPRYLRAIARRLEKLTAGSGARDVQQLSGLLPRWQRWKERQHLASNQGRYEPALDHYHWMLEEYRVLLFAQELGTAITVSEKRLDKHWAEVTT